MNTNNPVRKYSPLPPITSEMEWPVQPQLTIFDSPSCVVDRDASGIFSDGHEPLEFVSDDLDERPDNPGWVDAIGLFLLVVVAVLLAMVVMVQMWRFAEWVVFS